MASLNRRLGSILPLNTFFNILDLKLGSELVTYFALLNKVAGLYGLLAVFFGLTLAQLSLYLYSVASIGLSLWGLQQIGKENPQSTLLYANLFLLDHLLSTLYTAYFGVVWYSYTPHDGRSVAHSDAQKDIMHGSPASGLDGAERARKAMAVWRDERGTAAGILVLSWMLKVSLLLFGLPLCGRCFSRAFAA